MANEKRRGLGGAVKRPQRGGGNSVFVAGVITEVNEADENVTLVVKLKDGTEAKVVQADGSKLTEFGLRTDIGHGERDEDDVLGMGIGSKIYADNGYVKKGGEGELDTITVKGLNVLGAEKDFLNDTKPGIMVAFHPFHGKHRGVKKARGGYDHVEVEGNTAKVSAILTGLGSTLEDATALEIREAVSEAAANALEIVGGRSVSVHLMSEGGDSFSFNVPIYKDASAAYKKRKNGESMSKEDYLETNEDRIGAFNKVVAGLFDIPDDEEVLGKVTAFARTTEILSQMSAESHSFLIDYVFKDDLQPTPEALADSLKNSGWKFRPANILMGKHDGKPTMSNFFPAGREKAVNLPEALAVAATSLMPEFDHEAYQKMLEEMREEAEANRQERGDSGAGVDQPGADTPSEPGIDDDDVPSFD